MEGPFECDLKSLLVDLEITPNYKGYGYIICAIQIISEKPESLQYVTKELYPVIARAYGTDWKVVEHGIRLAVSRSWEKKPQQYRDSLGLNQRPSAGKFLAYIYIHLCLLEEREKDES